ncbi:hypothetical protein [Cellulomonas hominis]|uniref:hypothetical protein n=1 Tax=Cellulomonas hominis TaxID=156981 RepID=UPI001BCB99C2|nr:hypothetical protein [Cellulomonas hominis]
MDDDVELFRDGPRTVVKERATRRFFEVDSSALPDLEWQPTSALLGTPLFRVYLVLLVLGLVGSVPLAGTIAAQLSTSDLRAPYWWLIATYIAVQTLLHEGGHLLALRMMGRRPDRVGFKLNFVVFPAFYVRMNDVHLLVRRDKVVVHTAGLMVNGLVNLVAITTWSFTRVPALGFAVLLFTPGLVANSLPLLRSDGHKTLLAALGVNERRRMRDNPPLLIGLHAASWAMAAWTSAAVVVRLVS